jgi:hypothetical protein
MSMKTSVSLLIALLFSFKNLSANSSELPPEALSFDVNLKLSGFNQEQEEKVYEAIELIKKVIVSQEFRERVLNKEFMGKKGFFDNGGLSNEEIYYRILQGAEEIGTTKANNRMDLDLKLYEDNSKTIGYTYPHIVRIYVNKKYFDKFKPHQVADNLIHEWLHKLGFKHSVTKDENRVHSVPYSIGYLVRDLSEAHYSLSNKTAVNTIMQEQESQKSN